MTGRSMNLTGRQMSLTRAEWHAVLAGLRLLFAYMNSDDLTVPAQGCPHVGPWGIAESLLRDGGAIEGLTGQEVALLMRRIAGDAKAEHAKKTRRR